MKVDVEGSPGAARLYPVSHDGLATAAVYIIQLQTLYDLLEASKLSCNLNPPQIVKLSCVCFSGFYPAGYCGRP